MPRGQTTKHEMLTHVYKLKEELNKRPGFSESKSLANEYLNKVLDKLDEFGY